MFKIRGKLTMGAFPQSTATPSGVPKESKVTTATEGEAGLCLLPWSVRPPSAAAYQAGCGLRVALPYDAVIPGVEGGEGALDKNGRTNERSKKIKDRLLSDLPSLRFGQPVSPTQTPSALPASLEGLALAKGDCLHCVVSDDTAVP